MGIDLWIRHFKNNARARQEPPWNTPLLPLPPEEQRVLVNSLEQFQLGDGGGPAGLIAWNLGAYLKKYPSMREVIDLWFQEETEHSRLLGLAVKRFGGKPISSHWSFSLFCLSRRLLGIRFELYCLLLTEVVSNNFYKMLRSRYGDPALRILCDQIIRDETGHIAFHRARLAFDLDGKHTLGKRWAFTMNLLAMLAATTLWVSHRKTLVQRGANSFEFTIRCLDDTARFVARTRRMRREGPRRMAASLTGASLHTEFWS